MGVLGGVEEKQVRSAVVMMLRELTSMKRSASSLEHTQKCYQRYLEPQTLRRGTAYENFAKRSSSRVPRNKLASNVLVAASILF